MALRKLDIDAGAKHPSREELWRKRLKRETRCSRHCRVGRRRNAYRNSPRVAVARALLKASGLFAIGERNANAPELRRQTFGFESLPAEFEGYRILHLSDFHFDERPGFTDMICSLVRDVEVDLCLITGDYRFNSCAPCRFVYMGLKRVLEAVHARDGVMGILGNNDMSDFVKGFEQFDVRMLVNENRAIERGGAAIHIAGVDDHHEFRCDSLYHATRGIPAGAFTVLMAHSPEIIEEAARRGIDLYLCGHTHGGQMCLPGIGAPFLNVHTSRKYAYAGPWEFDGLQGYTTAGIGTSTLPLRFNCPPEAIVIELTKNP